MLRTLGKLVRRLTEQAGPRFLGLGERLAKLPRRLGQDLFANGRRCVLGIGLSLSDLAAMVGATAGVPGFNSAASDSEEVRTR